MNKGNETGTGMERACLGWRNEVGTVIDGVMRED